ncbi:hypothetical protein PVAR5_6930 [Paecilomyces variotii No. 5]|uniref:Major facilitator superfamily (MFS) profile domain-containing protein n=1 Tax=Byssochlamys spectabilis (strain No. 5 / NBRC 109023) TaxID=1356009 RepID=V5FK38_BYSSN|nr:hypothetical protein PVAR5_6930 [Paecilomyces variotii No. 5]
MLNVSSSSFSSWSSSNLVNVELVHPRRILERDPSMGEKREKTGEGGALEASEHPQPGSSRKDETINLDRKHGQSRKRGRPRMDIGQKESSDRRKLQIRMAQRAYRSRKEAEIVSLNQRIEQLEVLLKQIVETSLSFSDTLMKSNVLESYPSLAGALHQNIQRCFSLTNQATAIIDDNNSSQPTEYVEMAESSAGSHANQITTTTVYPDVRLIQQAQGGSEMRGAMSEGGRLLPELSDDALVPSRPFGPIFPALEMLWNDSSIYSNVEKPRFAHRLHRACVEYGYRCLRDPASPPQAIARRFNLPLAMLTREHITMHFQIFLEKGHHRYREDFDIPFFRVGGAGTHYTHFERDYLRKDAIHHATILCVTPQQASHVMAGDWFDCYDVEGFLKENNVVPVKDHVFSSETSSHLYPSNVKHGQPENQHGRNRLFLFPEEQPGFVVPTTFFVDGVRAGDSKISTAPAGDGDQSDSSHANNSANSTFLALNADDNELTPDIEKARNNSATSSPAVNDALLVGWYSPEDSENPQNWSRWRKLLVALQICAYTFAVYSASAIYVPCEELIMEQFHVGPTVAALGLALYVIACEDFSNFPFRVAIDSVVILDGLGPLLWSPMSEISAFGRNIPYITTFFIFVILSIPTALVNNLAGFLVLRFLQGFFGSPCLANGGASMHDLYSLIYLPLGFTGWVAAAFCGPALGPLLSAFTVTAEDWHWAMWIILWMSGSIFVVMFFFLPETSSKNILLRRAERLRKRTGNQRFLAPSEISERGLTFQSVFVDAVIKPVEISIKDPGVMFTNIYTSLVYGIYYSFFEVFPLVYPPIYQFSLGLTGTTFVCIIPGCMVGIAIYVAYQFFWLIPDIKKNGLRAQEHRLVPSLYAVFFPTISLFIFAWTTRSSIHWIVSVIALSLYATSQFIVFQTIFVYIPLSYPQYAASLFAANDFSRSAFAFACVLFSRSMYVNLGVGQGVSLLAGLSVLGIIGMYILYFYGASLRARSKFAVS